MRGCIQLVWEFWKTGFSRVYRHIHYAAAAAADDTPAAAADVADAADTAAVADTAAGYLQQRICMNDVISNTRVKRDIMQFLPSHTRCSIRDR